MTEEDLLNAPDSNYMNDEQLQFFKERLLKIKKEIQHDIDVNKVDLLAVEKKHDPADRAVFEESLTISGRIISREHNLLERIENALNRIEEGSYGYCEQTNKPIGIDRLLARPMAHLCMEIKQQKETASRLYKDERDSENNTN